MWSVRASEALDLIVPALRDAWAGGAVVPSNAIKFYQRHHLDTICGHPPCDRVWRIEAGQARAGQILVCPDCGGRTSVIEATEFYIRARSI
jgi:hypothetical protein